MTKVWLVMQDYHYEGREVLHVCKTERKAKNRLKKYKNSHGVSYEIEDMDLE